MDLQEIVWKGFMDSIDLAQEKEKWPAFVNAVMNFRLPQNKRIFFWLSEELLASKQVLCSMELVS